MTALPPALRERCWQPGQSGNPTGTGGEYQRCLTLCREASHDAAEEIIRLSKESEDERVRFTAAAWVYERAWGKPKEYDPSTEKAERPRFDPSRLTPAELHKLEIALRLYVKAMVPSGDESPREPEIILPGERSNGDRG